MSMKYNRQLPSPQELKGEYPLSPGLAGLKARRDEEIRAVFEGTSQKFLVVVGPCSADREDAVLEYAVRLAKLQEQVEDKLLLIRQSVANSWKSVFPLRRGGSPAEQSMPPQRWGWD